MKTQSMSESGSSRDWNPLKVLGATITGISVTLAMHIALTLTMLATGQPVGVEPSIFYGEIVATAALGAFGFGLLVCSAKPFDEDEVAPLIRYEQERIKDDAPNSSISK